MRLTQTTRRFRSYATYALGALLCLCFSLGVHPHKSSNACSEKGFSGLHEPKRESTSSPNRGSAKSIITPARFSIRGATRDEHSLAHPSNLPPEPITRPALSSSYSTPNNLADLRSLIFLSPLQDRAPPRFA
jgi:hypothetical protein